MLLNLSTVAYLFLTHLCYLSSAEYIYSSFEEGFKPDDWTQLGEVNKNENLSIRIALNERNLDRGSKYILDVSDPVSPNYGNFWTVEQVYNTFAPPEQSFNLVKEWLVISGIDPYAILRSEDLGWISLEIPNYLAERLFQAQYYYFAHETGIVTIASKGYSVPDSLKEIIDFVEPGSVPYALGKLDARKFIRTSGGPLTDDAIPDKHYQGSKTCENEIFSCRSNNLTCCNQLIHPGCIRALYKLPEPGSFKSKRIGGNALGLYEGLGDDTHKDLNKFFGKWARFIPKDTYPRIKIYGKKKRVFVTLEPALDYDCAYPLVYPQIIESVDGPPNIYVFFDKNRSPPNVLSISYSTGNEFGPLHGKRGYRMCNGYMKLGLLGTSVIVASGDDGVGLPGKYQTVFSLSIPQDCPYLTTVGATEVPHNSTIFQPEKAAGPKFLKDGHFYYTSGGGFSQLFEAPAYQKEALATYFANHDPQFKYYNGTKEYNPTGPYKYNRLGRGVPDIASSGFNIASVFKGRCLRLDGTSASAPTVAAIMNKIVEERLKAGKSRLGFLNPALYANPSMFNDITLGHNNQGSSPAFHAAKGWDPVTGLGTCNYEKMLKYFMSLK